EEGMAAVYRGLAVAGEVASPLGRVGKSNAGTEAVLDRRDLGIGADIERQRLQPQRRAGIAFSGSGDVVEEIRGLAVVSPGQPQVQGQVLADLPVIATVQECVIFAEIKVWLPLRDDDPVRTRRARATGDRCRRQERTQTGEAIRSVDLRQENVG